VSSSKVEEIIAVLWTIAAILIYDNQGKTLMFYAFAIKAVFDHACAIIAAVKGGSHE
jgi:hypothetical protein